MVENIHCHIVVMTIFSRYGPQMHMFVWRKEDKNERIFFYIITIWSCLIAEYTESGFAKDAFFWILTARSQS